MKKVNLEGKTFGRLTVIDRDKLATTSHLKWNCLCECGKIKSVRGTLLTQGQVVSCGCYLAEKGKAMFTKHGFYYHSAYKTWSRMMTRCHNPKSKDFSEYGERGILVCERWHNIANFVVDIGERPLGASIDRIDNSKGYEPENCRWSNPVQQANNRRRNVMVSYEGKSMTLAETAKEAGVEYKSLWHLFKTRKLPIESAIKTLKG